MESEIISVDCERFNIDKIHNEFFRDRIKELGEGERFYLGEALGKRKVYEYFIERVNESEIQFIIKEFSDIIMERGVFYRKRVIYEYVYCDLYNFLSEVNKIAKMCKLNEIGRITSGFEYEIKEYGFSDFGGLKYDG